MLTPRGPYRSGRCPDLDLVSTLPSTARLLGILVSLFLAACAGQDRAQEIVRVTPVVAHERLVQGQALLVCAYDEKKCPGTHLVGEITLEQLNSRLSTLSLDQEIVFC